jgi:hypothetical protein
MKTAEKVKGLSFFGFLLFFFLVIIAQQGREEIHGSRNK